MHKFNAGESMKYICVHGHFYQPPRENPSLEAIEVQDSAYPYHDWNERITAECYAPNAVSRIQDAENRIVQLVNNYANMSFNFGPTLLSWLETKSPRVYQAILDADRMSRERFSGHGSAIAQGYNHMILPLANRRDKVTQVIWGIVDFEHRFGRKPEGMWLPETAVNTETLEVLAENGIQFTILAPRQAKRVKRKDGRNWKDVSGDKIDPSRAYTAKLPSGKTINLFYYDGPISQGVAFEGLLGDGKRFADRLMTGFSDSRTWPQLSNIATDGESYGHHHRYGEMALTYALHYIESNNLAEITNYAQFLEKHPADHFVEIIENSSWSCVHGIERWKSDCGCNSGGHAGWNQAWRAPLRAALDWLRDKLAPGFEKAGAELLKDPWAARDEYIRVILDRAEESRNRFFAAHATHELSHDEQVRALKLLEMQRHALLMYTSCGWFFDEISGLETVQVIHYAGRALQLAEECLGESIEMEFLNHLREAKSNLPEHGDAAVIYEKWVKPAFVDIERVAAHYAISSVFENYGEKTHVYCYEVDREDHSREVEGKLRIETGRARFISHITQDSAMLTFAALYLGNHNITAGIRHTDPDKYPGLHQKLAERFRTSDTAEAIRLLDDEFNRNTYSLRSLFRDEQRKIVNILLNESLSSAEAAYRSIFENQSPLVRFLNSLAIPIPRAFQYAAEIALTHELREVFERPDIDPESISSVIREAAASHTQLDSTMLEYAIRSRLELEAALFAEHPEDMASVERFRKLLAIAASLPFPVTLWKVQNICYGPLIKIFGQLLSDAEQQPGADMEKPIGEVKLLAEQLHILLA
jgi:alpha-amylase/alpha-mannosidase (GH57 family)